MLLLNRAQCYLRLGWYNAALVDASKVRSMDGAQTASLLLKASFRFAKAHYMLGNYEQATNILKLFPENEECKDLMIKGRQRLSEQATGQYDWSFLFMESEPLVLYYIR